MVPKTRKHMKPFSIKIIVYYRYIRHSGFSDSDPPRVCLENLSETPPRGQKTVVGMTDWWGVLFAQVYSNAKPSFKDKIDHQWAIG